MTARLWSVLLVAVALAVAVVAFVAYGHGSSASTPAQRLTAWASSTDLGQAIGTLEGDGSHVVAAVAEHKAAAVRTVCAAMANDAQTANDNLPSPDATVTTLLARAYGLEYDAAEACYRAGTADAALLGASARDRSRAAALFGAVQRRLRSVTGTTVPTTTTTVVGSTSTSFL